MEDLSGLLRRYARARQLRKVCSNHQGPGCFRRRRYYEMERGMLQKTNLELIFPKSRSLSLTKFLSRSQLHLGTATINGGTKPTNSHTSAPMKMPLKSCSEQGEAAARSFTNGQVAESASLAVRSFRWRLSLELASSSTPACCS